MSKKLKCIKYTVEIWVDVHKNRSIILNMCKLNESLKEAWPWSSNSNVNAKGLKKEYTISENP